MTEIQKTSKGDALFIDQSHAPEHQSDAHVGNVAASLAAGLNRRDDADQVLGQGLAKFELVSTGSDGRLVQVADKPTADDIQNMLNAVKSGDKWGPAADVWKKVFQSELEVPGTTPENVARGLNMVGAAMNGAVKEELSKTPGRIAEPVGMAVVEENGKYYYYMMLNKDQAALARNHASIATGQTSDTVIKLGPFQPKKPADAI